MFPAAAWSRAVCKVVRGPNLSLSLSWFTCQGKKIISLILFKNIYIYGRKLYSKPNILDFGDRGGIETIDFND